MHESVHSVSPSLEVTCICNNKLDGLKTAPKTNTSTVLQPENVGKENVAIDVLSPFRNPLFWPELKAVSSKRKSKEKLPAVATSLQWQEYFKAKEEKNQ